MNIGTTKFRLMNNQFCCRIHTDLVGSFLIQGVTGSRRCWLLF
jgi:hypothetical protein